jgi:hypothetical protein
MKLDKIRERESRVCFSGETRDSAHCEELQHFGIHRREESREGRKREELPGWISEHFARLWGSRAEGQSVWIREGCRPSVVLELSDRIVYRGKKVFIPGRFDHSSMSVGNMESWQGMWRAGRTADRHVKRSY